MKGCQSSSVKITIIFSFPLTYQHWDRLRLFCIFVLKLRNLLLTRSRTSIHNIRRRRLPGSRQSCLTYLFLRAINSSLVCPSEQVYQDEASKAGSQENLGSEEISNTKRHHLRLLKNKRIFDQHRFSMCKHLRLQLQHGFCSWIDGKAFAIFRQLEDERIEVSFLLPEKHTVQSSV